MKIKTNIKAGSLGGNQTVRGLKVQSNLRAGTEPPQPDRHSNHNQTVRSLKVKSNVKAGLLPAV